MNFSIWRAWVKSKSWSLKWFIFLILLRPIIDNFYYLKDISPLLSPLYWAGVVTPLLCIRPVLKFSYLNNSIHRLANIWMGLIIVNIIFLVFLNLEFISLIQWVLRLSLPVFLIPFLRVFIRNKKDLIGLLTTFLYSAVIAALIMSYELVVNPIRTEMSRGIERMSGGYADIMNYAIYLSFGFLILSYFFLIYRTTREGLRIRLAILLAAGFFCMLGYVSISHTASYAVFAVLILLFITALAKRFKTASFAIITSIVIAISIYGEDFYGEKIDPLVGREIEVFEGEREETQMFHGRMSRWQYAWENFKDSPITAWLFGYSTSLEDPIFNISIGVHNDFLRIFYLTGIVGLFVYLLYLFRLWLRKRYLLNPEKYLLNGSILTLFLYSISTTPTLYPNLIYILFSIFVYFSLPPLLLKKNE